MPGSFGVIFVGDIVGKPGRIALKAMIKEMRRRHRATFVVANAENAASGFGITRKVADELLGAGVDVMTLGNHTWDKGEAEVFLGEYSSIVRPANYPAQSPGFGWTVVERDGARLGVVNLIGRVFMPPMDSPFTAADEAVAALHDSTRAILVDIHGEATSEKKALAVYLDGRATAVIGTHTHVQTADEEILPGGTAFLTDVGMTGGFDSIIGNSKEAVLERFIKGLPRKLDVATGDPRVSYAVVTVDAESGRALSLTRHIERPTGAGNENAC